MSKRRIAYCAPLAVIVAVLFSVVVVRHGTTVPLDGLGLCLVCVATLASLLTGIIWGATE